MATMTRADLDHIQEALALLFEPGQVFEIRAPGYRNRNGNTASGYFDDHGEAARRAAVLSGQAPAVYVTLNPVNPDLLARAANRIAEYAKATTADADIVRLRWLPLDFDPVRPSGISSSDEEHAAALQRARQVRADLREAGWPEPILADSGNGAHLLYRLDLAPTKENVARIRQALVALADSYDDDLVKLDRTVHNPARIWKVYGTLAAKGDNTPARSHRLAAIVEYDELDTDVLTVAQLDELAALAPPDDAGAAGDGDPVFDLVAFVERHSDVLQPRRMGGAEKWRVTCPWNEAHAGDAVIGRMASGAIWAKCSHNSCSWRWPELRERLEPTPELVFDHKPPAPATNGAAKRSEPETRRQEPAGTKPKLSVLLLREVLPELDVFVDRVGEPYARATVNKALVTMRIGSSHFGQYLSAVSMAKLHTLPSSDALTEVRRILAFHAQSARRDVFLRVGEFDGRIYIDLGTPDWRAIEVDEDGWSIVDDAPVAFRRGPNTAPLPLPMESSGIDTLRRYVNLDDDDWPLVAAWTVNTFRPTGPYPVLAFVSSAGSAKSTATRVLKSIIDPAGAALRPQPRDIRDLMVAAKHSWVLAFDNVSYLNQDVSDALCRLATGGGYTTRLLYSDDEEAIFEAQRPIVMNGIADAIQAPDLMDRAIIVSPPDIRNGKRKEESAFWRDFRRDHGRILGEFLNAVSTALRNLPTTQLDELPRMADFAKFATAAAPALGSIDVLEQYAQQREESMQTLFESSKLAQVLVSVAPFEGTATELLSAIDNVIDEETRKDKYWPKTANRLSTAVRRLAPVLAAQGVLIDRAKGSKGTRSVKITRTT